MTNDILSALGTAATVGIPVGTSAGLLMGVLFVLVLFVCLLNVIFLVRVLGYLRRLIKLERQILDMLRVARQPS